MQFQPLFVMRVYSHFFKILRPTPRVQGLLYQYLNKLTGKTLTKERGRWITKPDKVYGYRNKDRSEFRLHINCLEDFKRFLEQNFIKPDLYATEIVPLPPLAKTKIQVKEGWKARENQVAAIDYIVENIDVNRTKLISMYTGGGKTSLTLMAIAKLGLVTLIMVKPTYIEKWFFDLQNILKIDKSDIMVVQGGDHLRGLIDMANRGQLNVKFIILSNRTYQNYIKAFELDEDSPLFTQYECHPDVFYETLGVSIRLIDEVHQEFHANFKADLYTHLHLTISLSATLISHDPFMERMYEIAYPKKLRYDSAAMSKYINMFPVSYRFKEPNKVRTTEYGSANYSHVAFEKSILYRPWVLRSYLSMIKFILDIGYFKEYKAGDKCLIFAASINMCTEITRYLRQIFPNKLIRRYVQDDPYENLIESDICVTTILSGGTAHDIPGLRVAINTINIDSAQSNVQTRGRLRELSDRDVKYYYTYCEQIPKHKEYHERRVRLLKDTTLNIKDFPYTTLIG